MKHEKLVSICIPSFNRPKHIIDLLRSIDCLPEDIEIVICEDNSNKRKEIREAVKTFKSNSYYELKYYENKYNLGFDGNIRELVNKANGKFLIYMGDDDLFIPGSLEKYIEFLKKNIDVSYVLRSYINQLSKKNVEKFLYLPKTTILSPGEETVSWLFKRSVVLCGFTISRREAIKYNTSKIDGTLLYQVYLMCCVCLKNKSIYCDIPIAKVGVVYEDNSLFGSSAVEKNRYTKGTITSNNSINFTKSFFEVTSFIDHTYKVNISDKVRISLSKYSYPFLSIQRKRGLISFLNYSNRLQNECGLGITTYFKIYKWSLAILGEKICNSIIRLIKKFYARTPDL